MPEFDEIDQFMLMALAHMLLLSLGWLEWPMLSLRVSSF
jgi:hypothetical protein